MKKSIFLLFVCVSSVVLNAQDVYHNYKQFFTPNHSSFIELYLSYPVLNTNGDFNFKIVSSEEVIVYKLIYLQM